MLQDSEFVIEETFDVNSYFFQIGIQEVGTNLQGGNLVRAQACLVLLRKMTTCLMELD
jgi:hypothetical protein